MSSSRALIFALLSLGACTHEPSASARAVGWNRPDGSPQELEADRADCASLTRPREPSGGAADAVQHHNAFIACMKERGWQPSLARRSLSGVGESSGSDEDRARV